MKRPRHRQHDLVRCLVDYFEAHRFMPTLAELGDAMGITAAAANLLMKAAEKNGYVRREPGASRAIEVLRLPDGTKVLARILPTGRK